MVMNHRSAKTWLFDLDNTLYPLESGLFDQVRSRIGDFMVRHCGVSTANVAAAQQRYRDEFGSTLAGLMAKKRIEPEPFLSFVHDVDYGVIDANPTLARALAGLNGRRYIFTNGSTEHAQNVLGRLGIADLFDDVFDIVRAGYLPKPKQEPYDRIVRDFELVPQKTVFVEDMACNLVPAKSRGMTTVLVAQEDGAAIVEADYVISDLACWLSGNRLATS